VMASLGSDSTATTQAASPPGAPDQDVINSQSQWQTQSQSASTPVSLAHPSKPHPPLATVLPPLIFGTATFNHQFNKDPFSLDTSNLVSRALELGIRAFDTSPYYGPAEELLGAALNTEYVKSKWRREDYYVLTKCGRIKEDAFDYSSSWIRQSVKRSCERLGTSYLDVVYAHDVEFVTESEVMECIEELRRMRGEGLVRYVGICGYPVPVLSRLAERIRDVTGEPLDIVQTYANFNLQNDTLVGPEGLPKFIAAGVDVVPNASPLGMGLLRSDGVPVGAMGDWHPAPRGLREVVSNAAEFCESYGEKLEVIAVRYAMETWLSAGASVGSLGDPLPTIITERPNEHVGMRKLGVSVMGVSNTAELEKTMLVWRSILDGLDEGKWTEHREGRREWDYEWSLNRRRAVQILARGVWECLGEWKGYAWESPGKGWVNKMREHEREDIVKADGRGRESTEKDTDAPWPTPDASPEPRGAVAPNEKDLPLRAR
jgi:D-arabinose 1-dehydrogenase